MQEILARPRTGPGLLMLTAQSNVSNAKAPLARILPLARAAGWHVALDAAALAPTSRIRLAELDALAQKFVEGASAARQAVFKEAGALAETIGAGAKHYLRVMEKVVNGSEEYVEKETNR